MATKNTLPDVLRRYAKADGRSSYQLWKDSGVSQAVLSRFLHGKRDLNLRTAGRLCETLGLELRPVHKPRTARKGR